MKVDDYLDNMFNVGKYSSFNYNCLVKKYKFRHTFAKARDLATKEYFGIYGKLNLN